MSYHEGLDLVWDLSLESLSLFILKTVRKQKQNKNDTGNGGGWHNFHIGQADYIP